MWPFRRITSIEGLLTTHKLHGFIVSSGWDDLWIVTLTPEQQALLYRHVRVRGVKTGPEHIVAETVEEVGAR